MSLRCLGIAAALALAALGCRDLERFDTEEGESYCGSIVSAPFIRKGFIPEEGRPTLTMRLDLDMGNLGTHPGTIWTNDSTNGVCVNQPLFSAAPLRAIEEVFHDALSFIEFGDGREHNFFAWVDSCQGSMLAVVSLMKNDDVELRLLKPGVAPAEGVSPESEPGFALFVLRRQPGACGL